ncbi:T9SS type A sorting domain-containing protein [Pontibacter sp. G13]|uniref:T9SS type A sorting domain-containing protein n=1 Tax=Pontibacter sp. G13 TaxID=3074898 RepID=UPI00288A6A7F|nr:T9SS type A sorting domain-containing protein [Pontibacter sp. G13]WNJ18690.1 T9SS type A sorting domain-containing protein [Pontibacter sp. G13]
MKRWMYPLSAVLAVALACIMIWPITPSPQSDFPFTKVPKAKRIQEAIDQEFLMTQDPALGEVPRERLRTAREVADRLRNRPPSERGALTGITWAERGPNNVSGRTRAILIDANDGTGNTLWVGSVGGGLWKTTNAKAGTPAWTPVNDLFGNLAISGIAQDPTNANTIYFSTGEGFFNADAIRGLGIWKSTDGGTTWSQLSSTNNSTFHYTQKLIVASNGDVFAATRNGGVQRSTNGGTSWTEVLGAGNGASTDRAADIEEASNGDLYASTGLFQTDGIYKSTNGGTSWTKLTGGGLPSSGYQRIELAVAPSNSSRIYAVMQGTNYDCSGIYRSDNGGSSWTSLPVPSAFGMSNFCRGQAWYDLICVVDPNNSSRVFIGGIDILGSTNAGASWTQVSQWYGGGGYQYVHADQHFFVYEPGSSSVAYFGNDGGIFRTTNASSTTPSITGIIDGYNVTQFYAGDLSNTPGSNIFLAGAQDNGTHAFNSAGIDNTVEVTGGDGAFVHIDQDNPNIQISSYVYNNYYITTNNWGSNTSRSIGSSQGRFINPTDYDDDANVLYGAYAGGQYSLITSVGGSNTTGTRSVSAFAGAQVSAVRYSPSVSNRVYFGLDNGDVVVVNNATNSSVSGTVIRNGTGYVSSVEIDETNEDHILVTYSNYGVNSIYETQNGGSSWTSVEGNLPDMPVRWAQFNPSNTDQALVATELGVWSTDNLNGTSTDWGPTNGGLANVRTDMLKVRDDGTAIAATHGRGLFSTTLDAAPVTCNATTSSFPYDEGFEGGFGQWTSGGGDFSWSTNSGTTPSSGTGPSGAYEGSTYVYVEASSPNYPSLTAILESPCFDLAGEPSATLEFRYHMLGSAVGTIQLQASTDKGVTWSSAIWSLSGDQGSAWNLASVNLDAYAGQEVKLRFVGTTGSSWQGDICLDDLNITTGGVATLTASISSSSNVSCNGDSDGSATVTASGGTPPYSYSWSNGASTASISGLAAGTYSVTVSDAGSQSANTSVTITQPAVLSASITGTDETNGSGNGEADLAVSGGTSPYSYSWSNGATTQDLTGLSAGTYSVTVTDANGCEATDQVTIDDVVVSCPTINFNDYSIVAYGGQDVGNAFQIQDGGATLFLEDNTWKYISYNYTVTANTVIEFDFRSTSQGEIHGVAFDNNNSISSGFTFRVYGTQNWGIGTYDNYNGSGNWTTYVIPVGASYTGSFDRIAFIADHDASPSNGNAYFRNVKIYEGSCGGSSTVFTPPIANLTAPQDEGGPFSATAYPNPFTSELTLNAFGGESDIESFDVRVFDAMGRQVFQQEGLEPNSTIKLDRNLAPGVYIVRMKAGKLSTDVKVVKVE